MFRSVVSRTPALAGSRREVQNIALRSSFSTAADSKDEEKGLMSTLLSDYRVQLPIGFLAALPLMQHEIVVFTEETQLLGCFMVFAATVYSQAGDAIGKALDAKGESIIAAHSAQEDQVIDAVKSLMDAHTENINVLDDMHLLYSANQELVKLVAATKTFEFQHQMRAEVVKKLDYMVANEEQFNSKIQSILADKATENVKARFNDKNLQAKALTQALDQAANPDAKSDDVIKQLYSQYFNGVAKTMEANKKPMALPKETIEAAQAEVLALRMRTNNTDKDLSALPTTLSLF
jgi:hypothetical protein